MARVLIIDDDLMVSQVLREHLSNEGYTVQTSSMAEDGFAAATTNPPDLIMLDVNLPDATGFQMVGRFRKEASTKQIPIIMMTGAARWPNQQAIGKQMGANEYILKPFNVEEVAEQIKKYVKPPEKKDVPQEVEPHSESPEAPSRVSGVMADMSMGPVIPLPTESPLQLVLMRTFAPSEESTPPPANGHSQPTPVIEKKPSIELKSISPEAFHSEAPAQTEVPEAATAAEPPQRVIIVPPDGLSEPTNESSAMNAPTPLPDLEIMSSAPTSAATVSPSTTYSKFLWIWAWLMVAVQLGLLSAGRGFSIDTMFSQEHVRLMTFVIAGWSMLLGLVVAISSVLRLQLSARQAVEIMGLSVVPLVVRTGVVMMSGWSIPVLPGMQFWLRPLDIFETVSAVILGISLRRVGGGSMMKSLAAAVLISVIWAFASRGYFLPH